MNKTTSSALSGFKYIYLVVFFVLLSGLFHPLITKSSFEPVVGGVFVLLVGLLGGILLYKAAASEKRRAIFLASGFALMAISIYAIFQLTGRA